MSPHGSLSVLAGQLRWQVPREEAVVNDERIWQVRLPDGSAWIAVDARPGDPRASWIYARSTADMAARDVGGTVVEVTRHQKGKLLDQEIAAVLSEPLKKQGPKTRARSFGRAARRAIRTAILESVPLSYAARSAIDTARETGDDAEYKAALRSLKAGLPATWWVGYDTQHGKSFAQEVEPVWITDDPEGEDPGKWRQLERDEIASILVEAT